MYLVIKHLNCCIFTGKQSSCIERSSKNSKLYRCGRYSDKDRYFSFDAPCKAEIKWYFEDDYSRNKDAPVRTWLCSVGLMDDTSQIHGVCFVLCMPAHRSSSRLSICCTF